MPDLKFLHIAPVTDFGFRYCKERAPGIALQRKNFDATSRYLHLKHIKVF
jgi:hypothetical protein